MTSVKREVLWNTLDLYAEQGGAFISVLGTTKLGKSTLVKSFMPLSNFAAYIPGQNLAGGAKDLWSRLVADLGIPSSSTNGKVIGDKARWGFLSRFNVSIGLLRGEAGGQLGGEHHSDFSEGYAFDMDAPSAVVEAMELIAQQARADGSYPPVLIIDDFHFIVDAEKRREIVLALRPLTDCGVTVVLATLPGREADEGFSGTNVGGRHYVVYVPRWDKSELREIAVSGFSALNVSAEDDLIANLVERSHGSPQIMQQLCLNLCRLDNGVRDDTSNVGQLQPPEDWDEFFRRVKDPHSVSWLRKLGVGLTARKPRKAKVALPDGQVLDGYQLILWALHELGAPDEVRFIDVRARIASLESVSDVSRFALEQKAQNMNALASRDMSDALAGLPPGGAPEEDESVLDSGLFSEEELRVAAHVPQPVFEVEGDGSANLRIRILDPLLAYTLKWHPESFIGQ